MNVLFISQCSKRALTETRRILDQFAERRGERTWQTPITQAGLITVHWLLRRTARKNTAVACHWIRGRDHSELLWIVGDRRQFNTEGATPTHSTARDILRSGDESAWHHLPLMTALTALAALLHDLGKATQAFQDRLRHPGAGGRNHYRHEWVSVRLFQAFVGDDDDAGWLQRLASCTDAGADPEAFEALWRDHAGGRLLRDGLDTRTDAPVHTHNPFFALPPLAQAVAWLVLTHHRLPCKPVKNNAERSDEEPESGGYDYRRFGATLRFLNENELHAVLAQVNADWNEPRERVTVDTLCAHWQFPHGLPVSTLAWRKQAARYASKLLTLAHATTTDARPLLHDPFAMHVSRLCLMLADHHYSSLSDTERRRPYLHAGYPLYANTVRSSDGAPARLNQTLDEHLLGVQAHATLVARSLPSLAHNLPALPSHFRPLKKRSANPRFRWQDKAADLAAGVRRHAAEHGAFIVNMASTGCGKTLANARIMHALADPATGLRCAFAIGLRTLTLQTGRSFQRDLGLDDEQLAIMVGGAASKALFEYWEDKAEREGSASRQKLLDEGDLDASGCVLFEGNDTHPLLQRLTDDPHVRALLGAPLLVCTIDHLMPATESLRGGRQIVPMLRLLSGDLVLDEPDDFDMADLPALTRLVHWAGLLGSRVLLSSATLPPALVKGLFLAYRAGRKVFQRHRSERPDEAPRICCLWVDEFAHTHADCAAPDISDFYAAHQHFVSQRVARLQKDDVRRRAALVPLPAAWRAPGMDTHQRLREFAQLVLQRAWALHQGQHGTDPVSGARVSFGLIRMANIDPLYEVARALYQLDAPAPDMHIHLCVYHSQFPLLSRSEIERELDSALNRRSDTDGTDPVWQRPGVRRLIERHPARHHLFIVLGSPVTEVGRDHDYDWAVVEPSSMRSLIQLAGRVRRHRPGTVEGINVAVLDSNLRACECPEKENKAAYCRPGFEMDEAHARPFHLTSHNLSELLKKHFPVDESWPIDAGPRIAVNPQGFHPRKSLIDLEHARMHDAMLPSNALSGKVKRAASLHWHHPEHLWLTGLMPQLQRFRENTRADEDMVLLPDDDETTLHLHAVIDSARRGEKQYTADDTRHHPVPPAELRAPHLTPWATPDLLVALRALAEDKNMSLTRCAQKYATTTLPKNDSGWWFDERLGFAVWR